MEFSGHYLFFADRLAVWRALNDVDMLKAAIPGCSRLAWSGEAELDLSLKVNLGLLSPEFSGDLWLTDIEPAQSYMLHGKGRGGMLGLAEGAARISLFDSDRGTRMAMRAHGAASSTLMGLGGRLLGSAAQGVIDRFFARFAEAMDCRIEILPPLDPDAALPQ